MASGVRALPQAPCAGPLPSLRPCPAHRPLAPSRAPCPGTAAARWWVRWTRRQIPSWTSTRYARRRSRQSCTDEADPRLQRRWQWWRRRVMPVRQRPPLRGHRAGGGSGRDARRGGAAPLGALEAPGCAAFWGCAPFYFWARPCLTCLGRRPRVFAMTITNALSFRFCAVTSLG